MSLVYIQVWFMSGDPVGSTACVNVTINDDDVVEAVEMFSVNASSSDPVIISPTALAEISIADNDGKSIKEEMLLAEKCMLIIAYLINIVAVIALNPLFYETLEMESPLTVCTILVSGELETTITAAVSTDDQTAFGKTDSLITSFYKKK